MTSTTGKPSSPDTQRVGQDEQPDSRVSCEAALNEETECPSCKSRMHLWAGFYRCRNCGYKESCCF